MDIETLDINSIPTYQQIDLTDILSNLKKVKITSETREELNSSIKLLRKFKLFESSKWCSELLLSITPEQPQNLNVSLNNTTQTIQGKNLANIFNKAASSAQRETNTPIEKKNYSNNADKISPFIGNNGDNIFGDKYSNLYEEYKINEKEIKETLNYANTLFDLKEYLKCINVLSPLLNPKYPRAMFLYYLSKYYLGINFEVYLIFVLLQYHNFFR